MAKINREKVRSMANFYLAQKSFDSNVNSKYSYEVSMNADICKAILESIKDADVEDITDADAFIEYLDEVLYTNDNVTGNSTAYKGGLSEDILKKNVCDNWDLAVTAVREYGLEREFLDSLREYDYRWIDVIIRCYLLDQQLYEVIESLTSGCYDGITFEC